MNRIKSIIFSILLLSGACASENTVSQTQEPTAYNAECTKELGEWSKFTYSPDSSLVLAYSDRKGSAKMPSNQIKFLVIDAKTDNVLFKKTIDNGEISFYDNKHLKIIQIPGIMRPGQTKDDFTYLINIYDGKQIPLKEFANKN